MPNIGFWAVAGAGAASAGSYDLISTTVLGSTTTSITFDVSTLAAEGYKHLQIRGAVQRLGNGSSYLMSRINGATGTYDSHALSGDGSSVYSFRPSFTNYMVIGELFGTNNSVPGFTGTVIDIVDAFSTTKNKTFRNLIGWTRNDVSARSISLYSSLWANTSAITSIQLQPSDGSFTTGTRLSIYGIKG